MCGDHIAFARDHLLAAFNLFRQKQEAVKIVQLAKGAGNEQLCLTDDGRVWTLSYVVDGTVYDSTSASGISNINPGKWIPHTMNNAKFPEN